MSLCAYPQDEALMRSLGLQTSGFGRDRTDLGTVVVEAAEPNGRYGPRPASTVKVEVTALPAQFWRFTVTRPRDESETVNGQVRGVYEPLEVRVVSTGSGAFTEYWRVAEMLARNVLDIEVGEEP